MGGGGASSPTDRLDSDQFSEEEIAAIVEEATMANRYNRRARLHRPDHRARGPAGRTIHRAWQFSRRPTASLLKRRGCFLVPTLVTYHTAAKLGAEAGMSADTVVKVKALMHDGIRAVEIAKRAGIPMAYGTDLIGLLMHPHQLREFSYRREAMSAVELVQSATIVGAWLARMDGTLGRVAVGYQADLLAVDGNPLEDITVLEDPNRYLRMIMKGGTLVKTEIN